MKVSGPGRVAAVNASATHTFSKQIREEIRLLEGLGVEGDAHMGEVVKHRSRVRADATQPNLRQVHVIHEELLDELRAKGFDVGAGVLGENILTNGLDLLALPRGTILRFGDEAEIVVTGLRDPCIQLDNCQKGLFAAVIDRDASGALVRKAGIMGVVVRGGPVRPDDKVEVRYPEAPHQRLAPV